MNQINAAKRLREAAAEKAEAEKILQVKAAEASAEAKYLNGLGIARERKAIVEGLRDSVEEFSESVEGATASGTHGGPSLGGKGKTKLAHPGLARFC